MSFFNVMIWAGPYTDLAQFSLFNVTVTSCRLLGVKAQSQFSHSQNLISLFCIFDFLVQMPTDPNSMRAPVVSPEFVTSKKKTRFFSFSGTVCQRYVGDLNITYQNLVCERFL